MSAVEQLDWVKKYYEKGKGKFHNLKDMYLYTFFPIALDHSEDPNWIFQSNGLSAKTVADSNPGMKKYKKDATTEGITMGDFNRYIATIEEKNVPDEFKNQFA
ncbi:MAG: hypothetical protein LBO09_00425 [Candidatus Peribacteria bacterium]|jgi:hypothetical protein|nr:hypothetical protein [Candidatus Peribacteria bacterium]